MAQHAKRYYLICYDIANPKRLGRVHRFMKKAAMPLQYSVFVGRYSAKEIDALLRELRWLIDPRRDDIRAYPLPERLDFCHMGRQALPTGVQLHDEVGALNLLLHPALARHWLETLEADEEESNR